MRRIEPHVSHVGHVLRVASVTDRRPYTVLYRTADNSTLENCFYASDAFQARLLAIEFNNYIKDHPNRIVRIFSSTPC